MKHTREASPTILRRLRRVAVRWALFYGIIVLVLALLQRKLMYHPTVVRDLARPIPAAGQHVTNIKAETADGLTIHGWQWYAEWPDGETGERPVVLFFHGNAGNRGHRVGEFELLAECGADTVAFDYRGYAENAGKPTEEGLAHDARAAWDFVTQDQRIPPHRVFLFGGSLGGGVAVRLAAELCTAGTPPGGLILRSTFSSMVDAAAWNYPWLPVRWVLVDRYPSIEHAPSVTCPVLQMHGSADKIVPFDFGRRLFEAFPAEAACTRPKRFVALHGATHNGVLATSRAEVLTATRTFLAANFSPR